MRYVVTMILAVMMIGCADGVPGLRLAPGEEQKQTAQVAVDLAAAVDASGIPPRSVAARRLRDAAIVGVAYTGPPKNPVNVDDLLPAAVVDAWASRDARAEAYKRKEAIQGKAMGYTSRRLAELSAIIQERAKIGADEVIHRVEALADGIRMAAEVATAIEVPGDPVISEAEAARMGALDQALQKIQSAALAQAGRRPTVDEVIEQAEGTATQVLDILDSYGLLALIPGAGGIAYALRKRKAAKAAKAAEGVAEKDAAIATNAVREIAMSIDRLPDDVRAVVKKGQKQTKETELLVAELR